MSPRPLPKVGDQILLRFQEGNPNTWPAPGIVRAVVDDQAIVVRRTRKRDDDAYEHYELIDAIKWQVFSPDENGYGLVLMPAAQPDVETPEEKSISLEEQVLEIDDWQALGAAPSFFRGMPSLAPDEPIAPAAPAVSSESSEPAADSGQACEMDPQAKADLIRLSVVLYQQKYLLRRAIAVVAGRTEAEVDHEYALATREVRKLFDNTDPIDPAAVPQPDWMTDPMPDWMAEAKRHVDARFAEQVAAGEDEETLLDTLYWTPTRWRPAPVATTPSKGGT